MQKHLKALRAAFPHTLPVLTGFFFTGIAYGLLMNTKGYGAIWATLMSAIAYCGSMQYVAVNLLVISFNPLQGFLMSLMVNARHLFYGISMLKKYRGLGKIKYFLIFWLCDETFSLVCSVEPPRGVEEKWFYFYISMLNYSYWVISTLLGGLLGNLITFNTKGIDFALTALFVVIFLNGWKERANRPASLIGVICGAVSLALFGADNFIIPAMGLLLIVLTLGRNKLAKGQEVHKLVAVEEGSEEICS